jgi:hypothetical protein
VKKVGAQKTRRKKREILEIEKGALECENNKYFGNF